MTSKVQKSSRLPGGLIMTMLAMAGVIGYVMFSFLPGQKILKAKRLELQEKQQFIADSIVKQAQVALLEQELEVARGQVDRWRAQAETAGNPVAMLGEIAALASSAGVLLHRVTPQEPTKFETFTQQSISVEVEGSYSQVFAFLAGIESRPETIWVPKLDLTASKEDGGSVQCALDVAVFADSQGDSG